MTVEQSQWAWVEQAACRFNDAALFDLPSEDTDIRVAMRRMLHATAICSMCPVRMQCESTAQQHKYVGIWGGVLFRGQGAQRRRLVDNIGNSRFWFALRDELTRSRREAREHDERTA